MNDADFAMIAFWVGVGWLVGGRTGGGCGDREVVNVASKELFERVVNHAKDNAEDNTKDNALDLDEQWVWWVWSYQQVFLASQVEMLDNKHDEGHFVLMMLIRYGA